MGYTLDDFVATCKSDVFGAKVVEDFRNWRAELTRNGLLQAWERNYRQYHNGSAEPSGEAEGWQGDSAFSIQGQQGEILGVRVPESRNLITNALNLTYAKPIGLQGVATNSTPPALEAVEIANARMQETFKAANGGKLMRDCGEIALTITTGFADAEWDIFAGEAYIPRDNKTMAYTGATKLSARWPDEVRFDLTKRVWSDVWSTTVLQRANRLILASQLPDFADDIMRMPAIGGSEFASARYADDSSKEDIIILKYIHRPVNSAFLPAGRYGLVLEDGTALRDGDSPYSVVGDGRLGIFPITASSGMGSVYGYPIMNDLSPLQQWLNLVCTMIATLVAGYGAPNLTGPPLMTMDVQELVGGGRYFGAKQGAGEVKPLNLLPDMKPLFELVQMISSFGEKISGMNTVVRGGAEKDMSGKAVALWKSMAVQFMSSFMQSAIEQTESVGNYILRLEEAFASAEQTAAHVGDDNVQTLYKYRAQDTFSYVPEVRAEAVDPVAMTPEGREDRAWQMVHEGMIETPQEMTTMIRTGRDEPLYRGPMAHLLLLRRENTRLMKGVDCKVLKGDKHEIHIQEHEALLADPEVRENEAVMAIVTEHIARHELFMMGVPPMQGVDPKSGEPYPPAVQQLAEAEAQQQVAEQQAAMQQQQQEQQPSGGPPKQAQPQQQPPARTAQDAMQASAMAAPPEAA